MKPVFLYCLTLLLSFGVTHAQNKKLKTARISNPCDNELITNSYNRKGLLTEELSTSKTHDGKTVINKTAYEYDKDKLTRVYHLCNDTLISDEQSEYINTDLVHYRETVRGQLKLDEAYTYNKGRVIKIITTTPTSALIKDITYDDTRHLKETTTKSGTAITLIEKEYTNGNTKTVEHYTAPFTGKPQVVKIYTFDYDGNVIDDRTIDRGKETDRIISRFEDNIPASKKVFANKKPVSEIVYDLHGNILKEERANGETFIYESKFNTYGYLTEVQVIKNDTVKCIKKYDNEYWGD